MEIEYSYLIDDAKLNLAEQINKKMEEYKVNPTEEIKKAIIILMQDRQKLFLFDKAVIEKYI